MKGDGLAEPSRRRSPLAPANRRSATGTWRRSSLATRNPRYTTESGASRALAPRKGSSAGVASPRSPGRTPGGALPHAAGTRDRAFCRSRRPNRNHAAGAAVFRSGRRCHSQPERETDEPRGYAPVPGAAGRAPGASRISTSAQAGHPTTPIVVVVDASITPTTADDSDRCKRSRDAGRPPLRADAPGASRGSERPDRLDDLARACGREHGGVDPLGEHLVAVGGGDQ